MHVVVAERLPHVALGVSCSSIGHAVRAMASGNVACRAHLVHGELVPADDPARLADAERTVGADARLPNASGYSPFRKCDDAVGLGLAFERDFGEASSGSSGVSTCVMLTSAVPRPGNRKAKPSWRVRPYCRDLSSQALGHLLALGVLALVDVLEHDHLRAVDRPVRRLAARQAGEPGQRGIAGRVDEARSRKASRRRSGWRARARSMRRPSRVHAAHHRAEDRR